MKKLLEPLFNGSVTALLPYLAVAALLFVRDCGVFIESSECIGGTARRELWLCDEPEESDYWNSKLAAMLSFTASHWGWFATGWAILAIALAVYFYRHPLPPNADTSPAKN